MLFFSTHHKNTFKCESAIRGDIHKNHKENFFLYAHINTIYCYGFFFLLFEERENFPLGDDVESKQALVFARFRRGGRVVVGGEHAHNANNNTRR